MAPPIAWCALTLISSTVKRQNLSSNVRDSEGNIVGTQEIFWDMTDRQQLKQELQESRDHLAMNSQ